VRLPSRLSELNVATITTDPAGSVTSGVPLLAGVPPLPQQASIHAIRPPAIDRLLSQQEFAPQSSYPCGFQPAW
jgi:hypothetical protein